MLLFHHFEIPLDFRKIQKIMKNAKYARSSNQEKLGYCKELHQTVAGGASLRLLETLFQLNIKFFYFFKEKLIFS